MDGKDSTVSAAVDGSEQVLEETPLPLLNQNEREYIRNTSEEEEVEEVCAQPSSPVPNQSEAGSTVDCAPLPMSQNERDDTSLDNECTSLQCLSNQNEKLNTMEMENEESAPLLNDDSDRDNTLSHQSVLLNQNEKKSPRKSVSEVCIIASGDEMMPDSQVEMQQNEARNVAGVDATIPEIADSEDLLSRNETLTTDKNSNENSISSHTAPVSESNDKITPSVVIDNSHDGAISQNTTCMSGPANLIMPQTDQLNSKDAMAMEKEDFTNSPAEMSLPSQLEETLESNTLSTLPSTTHPHPPSHLETGLPATDDTTALSQSSSSLPKPEQRVKKGVKRKKSSASKGIQTSMHLLDSNSKFHDRIVDLEALKSEIGVVSVDGLEDLDVSLDEWPMLLVNQLQLRDAIIANLNSVIGELVECGQVLEQDLDYLKLKILELQQEAKRRAKIDQQNHKTKGKESESQTTDEDFSEAWSRWYYGCWGDYYSESDPTSAMYWPGHYTQQATVISKDSKDEVTQPRVDDEVQKEDTDRPHQEVNTEEDSVKEKGKEESFHEKSDTSRVEKRKTLKAKRRSKHKSKKVSVEETKVDKDDKKSRDANERTKKKKKKNKSRDEESINDNSKMSESPVCIEPSQEEVTRVTSTSAEKEEQGRPHGWDTSQSISQQVASAAAQAVVDSGYVFQEEYGLYYDYNTGYYYNAEDGLYYDTKSGTYFYYDHASQSYQFHSQVTSNKTKRCKRKSVKKKSNKSSNKDEDTEDKEEGECSESDDGEQDDDEEVESEQEYREEEDVASPDHQEEDGPGVGDIPPSLRLMVVEGGKKVSVGMLHVVTLNGGTVGREPPSDVHLPDISVSKIHAKIEYRSAGPEDHHYYIQDLGSMNGTYISCARLSEAQQVSEQVEIGHGWELQFGSIKVKCHLHPGNLTCNECEPGLVLHNLPSDTSKTGKGITSFKNAKSKEKARRKELKAMQKKYKLTQRDPQPSSAPAAGYTDRTLRRQVEKGSDNPYEKTEVASNDTPLRKDSRGYAMLQKMGWSQGQGLGKSNTGITEPVQPVSVVGQAGLGSSYVSASASSTSNPREERRKKQLQITQERYQQSKLKR